MLCYPGSPEKQNQKTFFIIIFILDSEFLCIYLCGIYPAWAGVWATFDLWLDIFHYIWSFSAIISSPFFSAHSLSLFSFWNLNLSFFSVLPLFPYSSLCFLFLFGSEFGCFFLDLVASSRTLISAGSSLLMKLSEECVISGICLPFYLCLLLCWNLPSVPLWCPSISLD